MAFPLCSHQIFELFIDWVYRQKVQTDADDGVAIQDLVLLWQVADMCIVPKLQNQIHDEINDRYSN